jgi:hypothetical protein
LLTYSFGVIKWSKTNLQNINIQTRVLFTKFRKHHPKSAIERFNLPRENGGRGFPNLEILQHNQIASLKNYFLNRAVGVWQFYPLVLPCVVLYSRHIITNNCTFNELSQIKNFVFADPVLLIH